MEQVNIQIPEGYVIDQEESNFEEGRIVFKKEEIGAWRHTNPKVVGFYVGSLNSDVIRMPRPMPWLEGNENLFATKKQAESMLAMAQLSQIIANDKRFGGPITDEEWDDEDTDKYIIVRSSDEIRCDYLIKHYHFLAFHTQEQRDLFLKENMDLVKQYYMLD